MTDFTYLDRIVVAKSHQKTGLATRIYRKVMETCKGSKLCLEVNLVPKNEASLKFHTKLGFTRHEKVIHSHDYVVQTMYVELKRPKK